MRRLLLGPSLSLMLLACAAPAAAHHSFAMFDRDKRQDGIVFSVEVTDFSGAEADRLGAIAEAEKSFATTGKVTVAIDARINREFGRELSVEGNDGSRQVVAIFFVSRHLVELVAKALPPNPLARSADADQFQQSLQFVGPNEALGGLNHYSGAGAPGVGR